MSDPSHQAALAPEALQEDLQTLRSAIAESVVGYEDVLDQIVIAFMTGGHVLLEGLPGLAKTTLAQAVSASMDLSYNRIQFTQDLLPSDITGHYFYNQKTDAFEFRQGPLFANVILADEINRASAKTQSALLEAMQEQQVTVEGDSFALGDPYMVIATQNPVDVEGVYDLPIAQRDRFTMKITMDYLSRDDERRVVERSIEDTLADGRTTPSTRIDPSRLRRAHETVSVDATLVDYVLDLIDATRRHPELKVGASTRAGLHLMAAARGRAIVAGRSYAIPDDVKRQAVPVLRHRLETTVDAELDDRTGLSILQQILDEVEIPAEPERAG